MKTHRSLFALLACAALATITDGCATSQEKLAARATISREQAAKTVLAGMSGGTITEGTLEREHGKLVWSFDIATLGSKNIDEVQVDAMSGEVVRREVETPAQQVKEAREKEKKGQK